MPQLDHLLSIGHYREFWGPSLFILWRIDNIPGGLVKRNEGQLGTLPRALRKLFFRALFMARVLGLLVWG